MLRINRIWQWSMLVALTAGGKSEAVVVTPKSKAYYRLDGGVSHLKVNSRATHAAFTDDHEMGLYVIDLRDGKVFAATKERVGASFFWEPNGFRVFYRQLATTDGKTVTSDVKAYDIVLHKSVQVASLPSSSGYLSFDPKDLRFHVLHDNGISTHRLHHPDERLARWQVAQKNDTGKWLATQKSIVHVTHSGLRIRALADDGSGVQSFAISPDGAAVAWATNDANVYYTYDGEEIRFVGPGRDPEWHPEKPLLVYSAARVIGGKVLDYDIRIVKKNGQARYLTRTPSVKERWPRFTSKSGRKLLYAIEHTTDLFMLDL